MYEIVGSGPLGSLQSWEYIANHACEVERLAMLRSLNVHTARTAREIARLGCLLRIKSLIALAYPKMRRLNPNPTSPPPFHEA